MLKKDNHYENESICDFDISYIHTYIHTYIHIYNFDISYIHTYIHIYNFDISDSVDRS